MPPGLPGEGGSLFRQRGLAFACLLCGCLTIHQAQNKKPSEASSLGNLTGLAHFPTRVGKVAASSEGGVLTPPAQITHSHPTSVRLAWVFRFRRSHSRPRTPPQAPSRPTIRSKRVQRALLGWETKWPPTPRTTPGIAPSTSTHMPPGRSDVQGLHSLCGLRAPAPVHPFFRMPWGDSRSSRESSVRGFSGSSASRGRGGVGARPIAPPAPFMELAGARMQGPRGGVKTAATLAFRARGVPLRRWTTSSRPRGWRWTSGPRHSCWPGSPGPVPGLVRSGEASAKKARRYLARTYTAGSMDDLVALATGVLA